MDLLPQVENLGPLFVPYLFKPLETTHGDCKINTYYSEKQRKWYVQPLCPFPDSEIVASLTIGLAHCDRDHDQNLVCSQILNGSTLIYSLSKDFAKFQFNFKDGWRYEFASWIRQALKALEFRELSPSYFDYVKSNTNYVIYKTPSTR